MTQENMDREPGAGSTPETGGDSEVAQALAALVQGMEERHDERMAALQGTLEDISEKLTNLAPEQPVQDTSKGKRPSRLRQAVPAAAGAAVASLAFGVAHELKHGESPIGAGPAKAAEGHDRTASDRSERASVNNLITGDVQEMVADMEGKSPAEVKNLIDAHADQVSLKELKRDNRVLDVEQSPHNGFASDAHHGQPDHGYSKGQQLAEAYFLSVGDADIASAYSNIANGNPDAASSDIRDGSRAHRQDVREIGADLASAKVNDTDLQGKTKRNWGIAGGTLVSEGKTYAVSTPATEFEMADGNSLVTKDDCENAQTEEGESAPAPAAPQGESQTGGGSIPETPTSRPRPEGEVDKGSGVVKIKNKVTPEGQETTGVGEIPEEKKPPVTPPGGETPPPKGEHPDEDDDVLNEGGVPVQENEEFGNETGQEEGGGGNTQVVPGETIVEDDETGGSGGEELPGGSTETEVAPVSEEDPVDSPEDMDEVGDGGGF